MSSCTKTGFNAYNKPHGTWMHGDAFYIDGVYVFRICQVTRDTEDKPFRINFTIRDWTLWFDERKTSTQTNSTMICSEEYVTDHGYEGILA